MMSPCDGITRLRAGNRRPSAHLCAKALLSLRNKCFTSRGICGRLIPNPNSPRHDVRAKTFGVANVGDDVVDHQRHALAR